jgi:hypothetical protein
MFEQAASPLVVAEPTPTTNSVSNKYKNIIQPFTGSNNSIENTYGAIDQLLEREKVHNKSETWNKLDKTVKIQKLHQYAEKYGREHALPVKEIKSLKAFFVACVEKNKLQKTKEVIYDKDSREISSIPALHFNAGSHSFTLKNMDAKRVSTIKSLTPKRNTERNLQDGVILEGNVIM